MLSAHTRLVANVPLDPNRSLNMLEVEAARPLRSELMFEKKSRCVAASRLVVCRAVESRRDAPGAGVGEPPESWLSP